MKVAVSIPLSWIAEYLASLCYYQGDEDHCPVDAEVGIECPFEPDEHGCTHCSGVKPKDWLCAIDIAEQAKKGEANG